MQRFTDEQLQYLLQTKTLVIETRRSPQDPSHTTPIWIVVADQQAYARSYRGQAGRWYQEITAHPLAVLHISDEQLTVQAVQITDAATLAHVSQALLQKYPPATYSYAASMVRDEILSTTLRLAPAPPLPAALAEKPEQKSNR